MRFIENASLNRLNVLLESLDLGDRIVTARLELFDTAAKQETERRLSARLDEELTHSPKWLSSSPLGPLQRTDVRELLVILISTMNHCFPDYDFSTLSPAKFRHNEDLGDVYNTIQTHLSIVIERLLPRLMDDIMDIVRECLSMPFIDVYSYVADSASPDSDPFSSLDCIYSFDFFFVDKKTKRILSFSCMTKSKFGSSDNSEQDDEMRDSEIFSGMSSGHQTIGDNRVVDPIVGSVASSLMNADVATSRFRLGGEYAFDDDMDDVDDDLFLEANEKRFTAAS